MSNFSRVVVLKYLRFILSMNPRFLEFTKTAGLSALFSIVAFSANPPIETPDVRVFERGLTIEVSRTSPPFVAMLEDDERELPTVEYDTARGALGSGNNNIKIVGLIELVDGLAATEADSVRVFRVINEQSGERAQVDLKNGQFEVQLSSLAGELSAELRSPEGEVLGTGRASLEEYADFASVDGVLSGIRISLSPVPTGFQVQLAKGFPNEYSMRGKGPALQGHIGIAGDRNELNSNSNGLARSENVKKDSSFLMYASAVGHWPTVAVATTGIKENTVIPLFGERTVQALYELSGLNQELGKTGVILGEVVRNGHSVAHARVELIGPTERGAVYFNSFDIPDFDTASTFENGRFAFVGLDQGTYHLRATVNNQQLPSEVVAVAENGVSYIKIHQAESHEVQLIVYEALNGPVHLDGTAKILGQAEYPIARGQAQLRVSNDSSLMIIEIDSGPKYIRAQAIVPRRLSKIHAPMISKQKLKEWLLPPTTPLEAFESFLSDPNHGLVVGYIEGAPFHVEMTSQDQNYQPHIVYFDWRGEVVSSGVTGGGFVISNAPLGFQTVSILPEGGAPTYKQLIYSEAGLASLVTVVLDQ